MKPILLGGDTTETTSQPANPTFNQMVAAFSIYTDSTKDTVATSTTGTISIQGRLLGSQGWNDLDGSPIDVSDDTSYVSTSIPLAEIRAVPDSIVGDATYYEITVTANDH